ncbi:hypothetical protein GCM10025880_56970 [Methylorubrum aminovorans]|uniref:hypothetical protein n=1 Tax=Methylorubrum aminovorans TaxID=269069 RepID=UPI0023EA36CF|nr:hypothetical protein [Methylorubrum aminovorans]GMA79280.1 hypothetical protein GCM10025880_56970 [Methylorubrum aminovorans]
MGDPGEEVGEAELRRDVATHRHQNRQDERGGPLGNLVAELFLIVFHAGDTLLNLREAVIRLHLVGFLAFDLFETIEHAVELLLDQFNRRTNLANVLEIVVELFDAPVGFVGCRFDDANCNLHIREAGRYVLYLTAK